MHKLCLSLPKFAEDASRKSFGKAAARTRMGSEILAELNAIVDPKQKKFPLTIRHKVGGKMTAFDFGHRIIILDPLSRLE